MPSAVRDPELVIFLKRLAAHTPMKFFCEREEERFSSSGRAVALKVEPDPLWA